jgi:hypothetical protein
LPILCGGMLSSTAAASGYISVSRRATVLRTQAGLANKPLHQPGADLIYDALDSAGHDASRLDFNVALDDCFRGQEFGSGATGPEL